jgi:hypothetical protein
MTWSQKRKLLYFGFFAAIVAIVVGIPVFSLVYEKPTCFDGKQNQDERGVDCGGRCAKLCKNLQLKPVVQWQQTFSVSDGLYTAAAYINNANVDAEAKNVPYTFTIYDPQNQVIAVRKGTTYIPPGQSFAVVETGIAIENGIPARTLFEFDSEYSWQMVTKRPAVLTTKNQTTENADTSPIITADVINSTFEDIAQVKVVVIVYDDQRNAFAASKTVLNDVPHESTVQAVFTWREPFQRSVSTVEIIPIPQ